MSVYLQKGLSADEAQLFFDVYKLEDSYARTPSKSVARQLTEAYGRLGPLLECSDSFQDGGNVGIRFPQLLPIWQSTKEPAHEPAPVRKAEERIVSVFTSHGVPAFA